MKQSLPLKIIWRIAGFVIFLILLAVANALIPTIPGAMYASIVFFFDANILLFFITMIIGLLNDIFWWFDFPFNVLGPISAGFIGDLIVVFLSRIGIFLNQYLKGTIYFPTYILLPLVFIVAMVAGYITILARAGKSHEHWHEMWTERRAKSSKDRIKKKSNKSNQRVEWDDVGEEFKEALYNLGRRINEAFEGDSRKKRHR